jgi:hypothetical protein
MNEITISQRHPLIDYIIPFFHYWIEDLEKVESNWDLVNHLRKIKDDIDFDILYNRDRMFTGGIPEWITDILKTIKNTMHVFINTMFPISGKTRNTGQINTSRILRKNVTERTINLLRKSLNDFESGPINEDTQPITLKELL